MPSRAGVDSKTHAGPISARPNHRKFLPRCFKDDFNETLRIITRNSTKQRLKCNIALQVKYEVTSENQTMQEVEIDTSTELHRMLG